MRTQLILIALLLPACGKAPVSAQRTIDPELQPLVNQFVSDAKAHGIQRVQMDTSVVFGSLQGIESSLGTESGIAECDSSNNIVTIYKTYYETLTDLEKRFLIYHELGHCYLHRAHRMDTEAYQLCNALGSWTPATCPQGDLKNLQRPMSIMHPTTPTDGEVYAQQDDYLNQLIDELFSQGE